MIQFNFLSYSKDLYLKKTGCPWIAKYACKLTTVATAPFLIMVVKTWSFYLNQAGDPIEKLVKKQAG